MKNLRQWLIECEGFRNFPYQDTVGKLTIGVGRNLDDCGLHSDEINLMLDNDIEAAKEKLSIYTWYNSAPPGVKDALVNMCFNMGIMNLLGFKRMISALINHDYESAASHALDSKWAKQVPNRAIDITGVIREGK